MYKSDFALFTPNSENSSEKVLNLPENAKTHADFFNWIARDTMPESPAWSGLPANAEMRVRAENSRVLIKEFKEMQGNEEDKNFEIAKKGKEDKTIKPAHIAKLERTCLALQ
jgi:hypothetical protein